MKYLQNLENLLKKSFTRKNWFTFDKINKKIESPKMDIRGKNFLLIGGTGLIGSHTLDQLLKEDVAKVTIFDNFTRGASKI